MEQHINYITLGVGDLAISRRFYQDIFGWQERWTVMKTLRF